MKYKINPIFQKETSLRVRTVKFTMIVFGYNLLLLAIAIIGFEVVFNIRWNSYVDYSGVNMVYMVMVCLETLMVIFMVPAFTAGGIAGEREKQTLDILMTTAISPGQIIWGKLVSCISTVILLVFSSLPILSIVLTVGGIGLPDLFQIVLVLLAEAVFIGSIGILASVMFRKTVHATIFSFGMVLFLCLGTIALVAVAYLLQQMYYWNVMQGAGEIPKVSGCLLLLMINPMVTVAGMISQQYGNAREIVQITEDMGGLPPFVLAHWSAISLLLQTVIAVVLLHIAENFLNPLHVFKINLRRKAKMNQIYLAGMERNDEKNQ